MPKISPIESEPYDLMRAAEPAQPRLPAWLLSCVLHVAFVFVLAIFVRDTARGWCRRLIVRRASF